MNHTLGPLISVVTVVFNANDCLEETIISVLNQSYANIEYIIIDGGSLDGSVDLIKRFSSRLAYWVSEPDRGIYEAMNKGTILANGEWIVFLNAGDRFFRSNTLDILSRDLATGVDIVYGDVEIAYDSYRIIKKCGDLKNIWQGMQFCHQSTAVNRKRLIALPFNIANPIAADLEWFIRAYDGGWKYRRHRHIISTVSAGGISDANQYQAIVAIEKAVRTVRNDFWLAPYFMTIRALICLKRVLKVIMPNSALRRVRMMRS